MTPRRRPMSNVREPAEADRLERQATALGYPGIASIFRGDAKVLRTWRYRFAAPLRWLRRFRGTAQ